MCLLLFILIYLFDYLFINIMIIVINSHVIVEYFFSNFGVFTFILAFV